MGLINSAVARKRLQGECVHEQQLAHLAAIDAQAWPSIATVPGGSLLPLRARIAEAHFAKACRNAGLELDPGAQPDLIIDQESLFARIAQAGWLGFVESYLAGEWRTPDSAALVKVLTRLLATGYAPRGKVQVPVAPYDGGQIPADLVRLYSDEKTSSFAGIFSTGVATTVRDSMTSYVPGQHGNHEPKHHFIDVTSISEPQDVERDDFHDSQARAAQFLLDDLGVTASSHLLEFPANGSVLAEVAGRRRAVVDTLSNDAEHLAALRDDLVLAGVEDFVHTQHISNPLPTPSDWQGRYDAIACMEAFEYLSRTDRVYFLRHAGRLLAPGGKLGLQTLVATDGMTASARNALLALRAYIWPGLDYLDTTSHHKLFDQKSGLRIIKQTHFGSHYRKSLQLQRSFFEGHMREAAASGFDAVYRRLWVFQLALRETLLDLGMLDAVQFTATHRHRRGRR